MVRKRKYSNTFDQDNFTDIEKIPKRWYNGAIAKDVSGNVQYIKILHTEKVLDTSFCKWNKLGPDSHPVECFEAFYPMRKKINDTGKSVTMENFISWTNTKARMQNTGLGGKYNNFVDFILDGLVKNRWDRGTYSQAVMSRVINCSICGVNLCLPWFTMFHEEENITYLR